MQFPLGQGQSDVQGRCRVATANSSYSKAQDAYGDFNRVNDQGSPCSRFFTVAPSGMNKKTVQASPCLLICRGDTDVFQVADYRLSCGSYRKHHVSSPVMVRLRNVGSSSALLIRSPQIVILSSRWSCVRKRDTLCWETLDMFRSSVRIL